MSISKAARELPTLAANIQRGYNSSAEQMENAMEEYPLAVGFGFAALGALIGVLASTDPP